MRFVAGAELSVSWHDVTLARGGAAASTRECAPLVAGLASIRDGRSHRARRIADSLAAAGIPGAYEGAMKYVTSERLISRTHFARFLVESGPCARNQGRVQALPGQRQARSRRARVGDDDRGVDWIHAAGGQAVLAHPAATRSMRARMRELLAEFRDTGGDAIEVRVAEPHARANRRIRAPRARCSGCSRRAAPTTTVPAKAGPISATCRHCPPACPGMERLVGMPRPPHGIFRLRPDRHHRRDARQQPAVAIRRTRVPAADDSVRRHAGKDRRGRAADRRERGDAKAAGRWCSARSSTRR